MTIRDAFVREAERYIGKPYLWAGDDPVAGFDCSGLVIEAGTAIGLYPPKFDTTAAGLYAELAAKNFTTTSVSRVATLAFWSMTHEPSKIHHVEIVAYHIDAPARYLTIGASGGGSTTVDVASAIKSNAYVKVRPLSARGMFLFLADPFLAV